MRWADVAAYVRAVQGLLRGETVDWEGRRLRMLHGDGFAPERPIDVPFLIGADGPKGMAVAAELGQGVFSAGVPSDAPDSLKWRGLLAFGTVLEEGEDPATDRVRAAAGHALAVVYHALYERGGPGAVDGLPGGSRWREAVEAAPPSERHLAVHEGHLVAMNDRDALVWEEAAPLLTSVTFSGTAGQIRERLAQLEEAGITEIACQPSGPDMERELTAFASAAGL